MILNLDELDNTDNLEDGKPSNALLTYHVTADEDLHVSTPTPHSTRSLKIESLFL